MLGLKCGVENSEIIRAAYDNKLLLVPAADNVVRVLPPLNITFDEINVAGERFENLVEDVISKL